MSPTSSRNSVPSCASSKRPIFCVMAPVKAPFSWPNSSLSSSPVGIAAQLILTKVRSRRGLKLVKCAGDQLLARAGLAANEHRGVGGGDGFDLLQNAPQGAALADDLLEVVFGADLFFEVEFLLGQLVFQLADLPVGLCVLDGDRNLLGDLAKQFHFVRAERIFAPSADIQCAEHAVVGQKRDRAKGSHSFVNPVSCTGRLRSQVFQVLLAKRAGLPVVMAMLAGVLLQSDSAMPSSMNDSFFANDSTCTRYCRVS